MIRTSVPCLRHHTGVDDAVEKVAVMADEDDEGAGIVAEHLFSTSRVSRSRSLVGSSSTSTFDGPPTLRRKR